MKPFVAATARRPHAEPAPTNDALAFAVGLAGWVIALVVSLALLAAGAPLASSVVFSTIAVGLALGILGLVVSRRRARQPR